MKKLEIIADELFNKIRGRYPKITLGDSDSTIVNDPKTARFFEFEVAPDRKVNVTLDEESLTMLFNKTLFDEGETTQRESWFDFLKELRQFARKRMLTFDTRDITKSNLDKRDYEYLSQEKSGDKQMSESRMYGTSQTSYQNVGNARLVVKHSEPIGETGNRNSKIHAIYIESANGEKFKYPFKHMNGARAAATHVSEGGNLYDDIGKHIVSLSEELSKLRKFKTYMNRSNVMAEGLGGYLDVVNERIDTVKETVAKLQKQNYYKNFVENFTPASTQEVPEDIQSDWIDQLTIRQFNEELKGVFPYIYNLVSEANAVKELGPEDLLGEKEESDYEAKKKALQDIQMDPNTAKDPELKDELAKRKARLEKTKESTEESIDEFYNNLMGQFADYGTNEAGMKPADPNSAYARLMNDINEIQNGAMEGDDMSDYITDKLGDYQKDGEPYTKAADIIIKAIKDGPQAQADAAEEAGAYLQNALNQEEGNAYAHKVRQAKMNGKKKGDEIDGPDGEKIKLEKEQKTPLGEFILSYFDRETGQFPKGDTAVLTMVEKDYGDEYVMPASKFIESVYKTYEAFGQNEDMKKDMANMKDLVKGVFKNPLKGDKEAKKANKKHGRDLAGRDIDDSKEDLERIRNLAGI